jgi:hypothetical protein
MLVSKHRRLFGGRGFVRTRRFGSAEAGHDERKGHAKKLCINPLAEGRKMDLGGSDMHVISGRGMRQSLNGWGFLKQDYLAVEDLLGREGLAALRWDMTNGKVMQRSSVSIHWQRAGKWILEIVICARSVAESCGKA